MRILFGLALSAVLVVAAGCGTKPSDTASGSPASPASIDGTYLIIGMEMDGEKMPDEMFAKGPEDQRKMVIKGDKMTGDKKTMTLKIDTSKSPAHIDVTETKDGKTETMYAIYKLDGDTLTICGADGSESKQEERPKEFKSNKKDMIMTMKKK